MNKQKKRVLMVTPFPPFPLSAGSRRVWSACKHLTEEYDFILLTFTNGFPHPSEREPWDPVSFAAHELWQEDYYFKGIFQKTYNVPIESARPLDRLNGFRLPDEMQRYYSPEMAARIGEVLKQEKIDIVHMEFDLMAPYVHFVRKYDPKLPCLLTHHDMGAVSLFRSYFREMSSWRRFLRLNQWWRRVRVTRAVVKDFDYTVVLTRADEKRLSRFLDPGKIRVVPTGVDLEHYSGGLPRSAREPFSVAYVGHYPHYPNEDAVLWFADKMMPLLWKRQPKAKFYVVGSGPTGKVLKLAADPRIIVTGTVPDVKPYEEKTMVMVAPLRLGLGIKGKILEGFAAGAPVVSTSLANEGIGAAHGQNILIADSPEPFVDHIVSLFEDAGLWERLSREGRSLVENVHGWKARAKILDGVYRTAAGGPVTGALPGRPAR